MPSRRLPNTTSAVIRTLTTARDEWARTTDPAHRLLTPEQWARLDPANAHSDLNLFLKEAGDVPLALAAQAPLTSAFNRGLARLTLFVSHFHQVFDLGVARSVFTPGARAFYGRDISATTLPDLSTAAAVIEAAGKIGPGEAKRAEKEGGSYIPMALPGAGEVAALHLEVQGEYNASQGAQAFTDQQQNELAALYPAMQRLAVQICNTVEYRLENDDAYLALDEAGRRAIALRWGLVYIYEDGTPATPQPEPTPQPNSPAEPPVSR